MWLINLLLATPSSPSTPPAPQPLPEAHARRLTLKRPARAGRMAISPWQKVAMSARRSRH